MEKFHIRLIGGWCGNRMVMVRDHLFAILTEHGYGVKIDQQSIWENYAPPQHVDLVLQLMPAFSEAELDPPSISVRPFLKDLDHPGTIKLVLDAVTTHHPQKADPVPQTMIDTR